MIEVTVPGMSCAPCARAVTNAVQSVDANAQVNIDLETKRVAIESEAPISAIAAAIEEAGYRIDREIA